jgi:hypothetical protein
MAIIPRPHWRDLSSWGMWLIVALVMLLLPWRTLPIVSCSQPTLLPAAAQPVDVERLELWQSPCDHFPGSAVGYVPAGSTLGSKSTAGWWLYGLG